MKISNRSTATFLSPIGPIGLVAEGEKLVAVAIGKKYSKTGSAKILTTAAKQLEEYFAGKRSSFELATATKGTKFQESVWREIARLPFGYATSYGQIAKRIGNQKASRAVGAAVGANPLPLVVGCHRVLGSGGKITGYTGGKGLKTKAWLLNHEGIEFS